MRASIVAAVLAAAVLGQVSCSFADVVRGNGKVETEERSVPSFSSVKLSGSGTLRIHKGAKNVEVTVDSNILPYITTEVSGGELKIGFKPYTSITRSTKLEFDVTMPSLDGVIIVGSGDAYVDAFSGRSFSGAIAGSGDIKAELEYDSIELSIEGSGDITAKVEADDIRADCAGSGNFYLNGSADEIDIDVDGSGDILARQLSVKKAGISVAGSGNVEIRVSDDLDAEVSGSGDILYWGDPSVKSRVRGSGGIRRSGG